MEQEQALNQSEELLINIIKQDPNNSSALAVLARVLMNRPRPDYLQSEKYLLEALENNPRNVVALRAYSQLLFDTGREGSLGYAQQAATLEPYSAEIQLALCRLYTARLQLEEALATCAKVREIEPANPSGYYGTGQVYRGAGGRLDQYIYWFAQAVRFDPDDPEIPATIARAWLDLDDLQQAQTWLDKAIAIDPDQPAVIGTRIRMLQALEQTRQARTLARQSLEAGIGSRQFSDVTVVYVLTDEALESDDFDQALSVLERVWPQAFAGISADILFGNEFPALHRASLLLKQNPASLEAAEILVTVSEMIERRDFDTDPNFDRVLNAFVATLHGDGDKAVELFSAAFDHGGLRREWRMLMTESHVVSDLQNHPGFIQLLAKLEAEAQVQRESAYKLLASLE